MTIQNAVAYGIGYRHGYYAWSTTIAQYDQKSYDSDLAFRESYDLGFGDGKYRRTPQVEIK